MTGKERVQAAHETLSSYVGRLPQSPARRALMEILRDFGEAISTLEEEDNARKEEDAEAEA